MKNLLLLLLFVSCATRTIPPNTAPTPAPTRPHTEVVAAPTVVNDVDIILVSISGFTEDQATRFKTISSNLHKVITDVEFKSSIEGWYWENKNAFVDTSDTPKQVYQKVTGQPWKLEYKLDKMRSSTVGYTLPSVTWIALNRAKYDRMSDAEVAKNICHEYGGHKLGRYGHSKYNNADRPYSVPYGLGYVCGKIYERLYPSHVN